MSELSDYQRGYIDGFNAPSRSSHPDRLEVTVADIVSRMDGVEYRSEEYVHIGVVRSWRETLRQAAALSSPEPRKP